MESSNKEGGKRDVCNKLFDAMLKGKDTVTLNALIEGKMKRLSFAVPVMKGTLMQKRTYARMKANEMYSGLSEFI